jgi:hypothetical protein
MTYKDIKCIGNDRGMAELYVSLQETQICKILNRGFIPQ